MKLLLQLLLAHFVADFILQPDSWVGKKAKGKVPTKMFWFHTAIHLSTLFIFTWNLMLWKVILIITGMHAVIDYIKIIVRNNRSTLLFLIDQLFHLLVIAIVWYFNQTEYIIVFGSLEPYILLIITGIVFLTLPASIIIKHLLEPWKQKKQKPENEEATRNSGYANPDEEKTSVYIGIVERILILIFILKGQWQAIGFLIAAKSVFRFKDIKNESEIKMTEYILYGTLLSFAFAIITGVLIVEVKNLI